MELIKRHKGLAIVGGLALILLIIMFAIFARMIFSNGESEYGDRLKNVVELDKEITNKVIEEIKSLDEVADITVRTQGKIVYTTLTFTESTSKDKAKEIATKTLTYYDEEITNCYDFEYLLTQKIEESEEEKTPYTIAGTKHPDIDYISWTRN